MAASDRICVVGAGAVGSWVGARLARAGNDVEFVARGAHGEAVRARGIRVDDVDGDDFSVRVRCCERLADAAPAATLLVCVKGHQLAPIAPELAARVADGAQIVALQNGIPWWYGYGRDLAPLAAVDPDGGLMRTLDPARTLGCVLYVACSVAEPGVVVHEDNNRFFLGRPDGSLDPWAHGVAERFEAAGLRTRLVPDLRRALWEKLLGNVTLNVAGALTRATTVEMLDDPGTLDVLRSAMHEALAVAAALGDAPEVDVEARLARVPRHAFKTSMLQDVERGRPLETGAIAEAVVELADRTATPVPVIRVLAALVRTLDASLARERR